MKKKRVGASHDEPTHKTLNKYIGNLEKVSLTTFGGGGRYQVQMSCRLHI